VVVSGWVLMGEVDGMAGPATGSGVLRGGLSLERDGMEEGLRRLERKLCFLCVPDSPLFAPKPEGGLACRRCRWGSTLMPCPLT